MTYTPNDLRSEADSDTATLLRANNIRSGQLHMGDVQYVPSSIVAKNQFLELGDIAVCMSNGSKALVGKSAQFRGGPPAVTVGAFCSVFKPIDCDAIAILPHLFRSESYLKAVDTALAGSAINNLKNSDIEKISFRLPSRTTWPRIAAILTGLDTAIEATEALIEKHQRIRAGLLHDLFARGVALDGSIRAPRVRSRADGAELDAVPAGWDVLPLQRCLTESASNGIYKPPHLIGSGALLVGQTAITEDRSVDPKLARRAVVSAAEVRRFGVAAGDVLVARVFATVEGVGRPALVPDLGEPAVFESNMMRLRVVASVIRPRLLFEWLKSDASRRHIEGRANASNQVSVNQSVLYPLPVPIPPMEEQDRMVERIEAADRARAADLAVLEKLRMQKKGLMQDLLTGKVRVPVPADASA